MTNSLLGHKLEYRYCAFLDILGFKDFLCQIETNDSQEKLYKLRSVLNFMNEETLDSAYGTDLPVWEVTDMGILEKELGDLRLTYISDCIIISSEYTQDGLKALCRKVTKIWIDLAWDGFFCRGAIAEGKLFHCGNILFGSAYLKAYELEQKAIYPRVILAPEIIEKTGGFPSQFPLHPPTADLFTDNFVYLRYFPWYFFPPYTYDWEVYLLRIRSYICEGLKHSDPKVSEKYTFLKEEFNFTINTYRKDLDEFILLIY